MMDDSKKRFQIGFIGSLGFHLFVFLVLAFAFAAAKSASVASAGFTPLFRSYSAVDTQTTFAVSVKKDGSIWLGDKQTDISSLTMQAKMEQKNNPRFSIVIRADKDADYGKVITLLDRLKGAGVQRFGLATDVGAGK